MSDTTQEEAHTGPIRTPGQLLLAVFFSFIIPIFGVIGLVYYVVSENKPAGATQAENYALGGITVEDREKGVMARIQKVGTVEIRDANRPLKSGEDVFKAQCTTCHSTGAAGSPKFGDAAAWGPRIRTGFESLVNSALHGKGAMPAQGGGDFDDVEVARAAAYMANAAGAKFPEPQPAAVPATTAQATAALVPVAATATTPAPATTAAAPAAAPATTQVAGTAGGGEALYKQACFACHGTGAAGAPKYGDKAAWAPRIQQGIPHLVQSALSGKGAMPPKGGTSASEADIRSAVEYMVTAAK
ncbi:MAG: putative Cytochrome c [Ramlibacter sp.]|nr:putative Cytochrome c [Ramlibacter sp.]